MSGVYYNEIDPFAAAWLRSLITAGHLPAGDVDSRDIRDVTTADVAPYTQCHFFAGIGGWAYALQLAQWPSDVPVWTGSCPCQPFSAAGRGGGFADERHLWPSWHYLIHECRPPVVLGEQVASPAGLMWFDLVHEDLEASAYAVGMADLGAASVGAPHIRQRLWFVAQSNGGDAEHRDLQRSRQHGLRAQSGRADGQSRVIEQPEVGELAESGRERREGKRLHLLTGESRQAGVEAGRSREVGDIDRLGDSISEGLEIGGRLGRVQCQALESQARKAHECRSILSGFWSDAEWIFCRDGKYRPVEPGTFPLAHGVPARVGRLRGYGNAIVPQVAEVFIRAYLDTLGER